MRTLEIQRQGFEGSVAFDDGTKSWAVYARRGTGNVLWTKCGIVGHAQMSRGNVDELARTLIGRWIDLDMVR